jgi:SAM-dependent methyltransferase
VTKAPRPWQLVLTERPGTGLGIMSPGMAACSMKAHLMETPGLEQVKRYEAWFSSPFGRRADGVEKAILRGLLEDFAESHSLLEVGCGGGHFTEWFADLGLSAVGLDRAPSMVSFARDRRSDIPFLLGDATCLPFGEAAFDVVALVTVLEFLNSPEAALQEARRVARRGLLLGVLNGLSPVALWRRVRRAASYRRARFFSPAQLESLLRTSLGCRAMDIRWRTGLYPVPWLDRCTALPFGAFVGLSVRFDKGG